MEFAKRLNELLARLGWSQARLKSSLELEGVSVSKSTVSAWCTGERVPTIGTLGAVLDVLHVQGGARLAFYELATHQLTDRLDGGGW